MVTKDLGQPVRIEEFNVSELAREFAEIPNTINIFLFSACRLK